MRESNEYLMSSVQTFAKANNIMADKICRSYIIATSAEETMRTPWSAIGEIIGIINLHYPENPSDNYQWIAGNNGRHHLERTLIFNPLCD